MKGNDWLICIDWANSKISARGTRVVGAGENLDCEFRLQ